MGTKARKARKRAGVPFTKAQKVPTPVEDRTVTKKAAERLLSRMLRMSGGDEAAVAAALQKAAGER